MFTFSLTNDQKRVLLDSNLKNLEMQLYSGILLIGEDSDTYNTENILSMHDSIVPSNEYRLYQTYEKIVATKLKIDSL